MQSIYQRFKESSDLGRPSLRVHEAAVVFRALEVLRRVAEGGCTNAQREAADVIREIDEPRAS